MKDKKKYLMWGGCILLVLIVIGVGVFAGYKLLNTQELAEDDVVYETSTDSSMFAIMITDTGKPYEEDGWPDPDEYEFDAASSYCIDSNNNAEYGVISYNSENNTVKFYTTSFTSCTVYFKLSKITDLTKAYNKYGDIDTIISSDGTKDIEDIWESTLTGDGYRYVGTDPDNYICFGTDKQDECTSDPSTYMYRIIGIFVDSSGNYHLKLIKMEALDSTYQWYSSSTAQNKDWNSTTLYSGLNGSYYLNKLDSTWSNLITSWTWTLTNTRAASYNGSSYVYSTAGQMYEYSTTRAVYYHETNQANLITDTCYVGSGSEKYSASCTAGSWTTVGAKIGLMYASDYLLSLGSSALTLTSQNNASTLKTGWMHLSNNDSDAPYSYEWTINRMGYFRANIWCDIVKANGGGSCTSSSTAMQEYSYSISSGGAIGGSGYATQMSVRPVFYLENSVTVISGTGTIDDPYTLEV